MAEGLEDTLNDINNTLENINNKIEEIHNKLFAPVLSNTTKSKDTTYQNKRKAYLTKLNNGDITNPKPTTMEYYEIKKEGDVYV